MPLGTMDSPLPPTPALGRQGSPRLFLGLFFCVLSVFGRRTATPRGGIFGGILGGGRFASSKRSTRRKKNGLLTPRWRGPTNFANYFGLNFLFPTVVFDFVCRVRASNGSKSQFQKVAPSCASRAVPPMPRRAAPPRQIAKIVTNYEFDFFIVPQIPIRLILNANRGLWDFEFEFNCNSTV